MLTYLLKRLIPFLLLPVYVSAQEISETQRINQAVLNKVEYHFNQQEADSIYAMTGSNFRLALSLEAFLQVTRQQLFPLGTIQESELIKFENNIGFYKVDFASGPIQVVLGLDSNHFIHTLLFQPYQHSIPEKTEPIASNNPKASETEQQIDSIALAYTRKGNTQALAIGILKDGKISRYFYGDIQKGKTALPNSETLFEIGSITKTFAATLLAYAAETGLLDIDAAISDFLPDSVAANPALQRISLKQLANHTSGMPRLPANAQKAMEQDPLNPYKHYTQADLYTYLKNYQAAVAPDSIYQYSNLGYGVLGNILSAVYEKTFDELVQETICQPLNLQSTTEHPTAQHGTFVKVHNQKGEETPAWEFDVMSAAGSLKSNVDDLIFYANAHFKLPETALEYAMAQTRQFTFHHPPDTDLGLGWHTQMKHGALLYQHTGGTYGSSSYISFSPDKKIAIVVLSNAAESVSTTGDSLTALVMK